MATKAGRRLNPHVADGYTAENIEAFIDRSLTNLVVETLDLVQLHCPPTEVFYRPDMFGALDELTIKGKIRNYGVSVSTVEEGLKAIEYPGVATIQIIYNIFRQRPHDLFFAQAQTKNVGIIVRVPLASGLLSGKITADTPFAAGDPPCLQPQRRILRLSAKPLPACPSRSRWMLSKQLRPLVPEGVAMAPFALRWILENPAVSVVIPGARNEAQARGNASASALPAIAPDTMAAIADIYERLIKVHVHQKW